MARITQAQRIERENEEQALSLRLQAGDKHIVIDGKTSRRSFDTASGKRAVHTVSAWMSEAGLVIGQKKTETKSNEITAIPELLSVLDLRGATITIDAMGCQREIAKAILTGDGDYLLAVKDNQPTLHRDLQTTFDEAADARQRTVDEQPRPPCEVTQDVDKGHGRVESRTVTLCRDLVWLTSGPALERSELRGAGRQAVYGAVHGQDLHRDGLLHRQRC